MKLIRLNRYVVSKIKSQADLFQPTMGPNTKSPWDCIVGSVLQVANGIATHSTINEALVAAPSSDGNILILRGTYTENVSLTQRINIEGQGYGTQLNGTFAMSSGANFSVVTKMNFLSSITLATGTTGIFLRDSYQAASQTLQDSGTGNSKLVVVV